MANADAAFGFRPVMDAHGKPYSGAANMYLATCGTSLFIGDPVLITGESNSAEIEGMGKAQIPIVNVVGTNDTSAISGVIVGVVPTNNQSTTYYAGTKTATAVWVADDPTLLFEVQTNGNLATQGVVGAATSTISGTGSTVTGRSAYEVNSTTATQGVWVIERVAPKPTNNDVESANAVVWVSCRKHTKNQSGGRVSGLGVGIA